MATWTCHEAGCTATGESATVRGARKALEHHYLDAHNEIDW